MNRSIILGADVAGQISLSSKSCRSPKGSAPSGPPTATSQPTARGSALPTAETGTGVLLGHYGFREGYRQGDLGYTAQTWALILDPLATYVASGSPEPFFQAAAV